MVCGNTIVERKFARFAKKYVWFNMKESYPANAQNAQERRKEMATKETCNYCRPDGTALDKGKHEINCPITDIHPELSKSQVKEQAVSVSSTDLLNAVRDVRKSDCGAWLKDCGTAIFTCGQGRDKRLELARLLSKLYKVAGI